MTRIMTDEELKLAVKDSNDSLGNLRGTDFPGPFPPDEVLRREAILLRQVTVYKILDARESGDKDLESLHTVLYDIMAGFLKSCESS